MELYLKNKIMKFSVIYDKDDRICTEPLTRENMGEMANRFNIKSCWLETNYFLMPPFKKRDLKRKAKKVSTHYMNKVLKNG